MPRYDLVCMSCGQQFLDIIHSIHDPHPACPCGSPTESLWRQAPMVNSDDIPGGLLVRHGVCWPDGSPRKYYSKSEIRKAATEAGLTIGGETPNLSPKLKEKLHREQEEAEIKAKHAD